MESGGRCVVATGYNTFLEAPFVMGLNHYVNFKGTKQAEFKNNQFLRQKRSGTFVTTINEDCMPEYTYDQIFYGCFYSAALTHLLSATAFCCLNGKIRPSSDEYALYQTLHWVYNGNQLEQIILQLNVRLIVMYGVLDKTPSELMRFQFFNNYPICPTFIDPFLIESSKTPVKSLRDAPRILNERMDQFVERFPQLKEQMMQYPEEMTNHMENFIITHHGSPFNAIKYLIKGLDLKLPHIQLIYDSKAKVTPLLGGEQPLVTIFNPTFETIRAFYGRDEEDDEEDVVDQWYKEIAAGRTKRLGMCSFTTPIGHTTVINNIKGVLTESEPTNEFESEIADNRKTNGFLKRKSLVRYVSDYDSYTKDCECLFNTIAMLEHFQKNHPEELHDQIIKNIKRLNVVVKLTKRERVQNLFKMDQSKYPYRSWYNYFSNCYDRLNSKCTRVMTIIKNVEEDKFDNDEFMKLFKSIKTDLETILSGMFIEPDMKCEVPLTAYSLHGMTKANMYMIREELNVLFLLTILNVDMKPLQIPERRLIDRYTSLLSPTAKRTGNYMSTPGNNYNLFKAEGYRTRMFHIRRVMKLDNTEDHAVNDLRRRAQEAPIIQNFEAFLDLPEIVRQLKETKTYENIFGFVDKPPAKRDPNIKGGKIVKTLMLALLSMMVVAVIVIVILETANFHHETFTVDITS